MIGDLVDLARTLGLTQVHLNSQSSAIGFYARMDFQAEGPELVEVGIPHRRMVLRIGYRDEEQAERHRNTEHPHDRR
jgi:predicted GNAT family N-acyltransferase